MEWVGIKIAVDLQRLAEFYRRNDVTVTGHFVQSEGTETFDALQHYASVISKVEGNGKMLWQVIFLAPDEVKICIEFVKEKLNYMKRMAPFTSEFYLKKLFSVMKNIKVLSFLVEIGKFRFNESINPFIGIL